MTLDNFALFLLSKSSGRITVDINDQFIDRIVTGLKKIAMDTLPLVLVVEDPTNKNIYRRVDEKTYVRVPNRPQNNSQNHIDIDEALIDALSLYVLAGLEVQRAKIYMGMYWNEIDTNNNRLTESYLAVASNDANRFHELP